jgi:hypothetical protein
MRCNGGCQIAGKAKRRLRESGRRLGGGLKEAWRA